MATLVTSYLHACNATFATTLPRHSRLIQAPSVQFSQVCGKNLGQSFSSPSARILRRNYDFRRELVSVTRSMASSFENREVLDSKSASPAIFDGTTRLYFSSRCPYAQRVWVAVKYKGLDEIECVEISLSDKPTWYKEKVYPVGKVPALEHNGTVTGESMDLLTYLDDHFGGPKLAPTEESKKQAAAELLQYADTFNKLGFTGLSMKSSTPDEIAAAVAPAFDFLENALAKFSSEGPLFLGNFGLVDIVYAPFIERFEIAFGGIRNYDIRAGRPRLAKWIEAMDNVEAYSSTKVPRATLLELYKKMLENDYFIRVGVAANQNNSSGSSVAVN
ncbi:protein IN2-1 homolog B isoform X2 [Physcomitrium patens]|uniref:Lambda class glutathione S-transferase n=1 Tax=Physcomitrium patens TaxID=3218 RepID=K9Y419_PHYPA|nr:protein IN2-1 homolog B-like isoform X2 [Physcomitrium patens]AFZ39126.1 lambda class glutathione S-transferase [Physcomitrium patens]PNR46793.1 hypothetical protein PHYPA_013913 [Physcomitrium patens]|eukprot:XP_024386481.1 protein IN2-1 homolog B-like isoform X2 [Physcomitrella patens]